MDIKSNLTTLFSLVRTIFDEDIVIKKKLSSEYEAQIIKRLSNLPKDYTIKVNKVLLIFIALIESVDFDIFSKKIGNISFTVDSYSIAYNAIANTTNKIEKSFAKSILQDLQTLFACLDMVVSNPSKYAKNMSIIRESSNNIL